MVDVTGSPPPKLRANRAPKARRQAAPPLNPAAAPEAPKPRRKREEEVDPSAQAKVHDVVIGVCEAGNLAVARQYRLSQADIDGIFLPLERIALRHVPEVGNVNPDVSDALLAVRAIGAYGSRVGLFDRVLFGAVRSTRSPVPASSIPTGSPLATPGPARGTPAGPSADPGTIEGIMSRLHTEVTPPGAAVARINHRPDV